MEKRYKIIAGVIVIFAIIVIALNFTNTTGQATLTQGANYGPIKVDSTTNNCVYLTSDDGWDVTKKEKVQYFDVAKGVTEEIEDHCFPEGKVVEYHCNDAGREVNRLVQCPNQMVCSDGICVYE